MIRLVSISVGVPSLVARGSGARSGGWQLLGLLMLFVCSPALAQVAGIYDGEVRTPSLESRYDASIDETAVTASTESWPEQPATNVRLEAQFSFTGAGAVTRPGPLRVSVVRVGPDQAWSQQTKLVLRIDGKPVSTRATHDLHGVKIGIEESLTATIDAATLRLFARARRAEVEVKGRTVRLSAEGLRKLGELVDRAEGKARLPRSPLRQGRNWAWSTTFAGCRWRCGSRCLSPARWRASRSELWVTSG